MSGGQGDQGPSEKARAWVRRLKSGHWEYFGSDGENGWVSGSANSHADAHDYIRSVIVIAPSEIEVREPRGKWFSQDREKEE